ncbi:MarR family winged helix-turn-helix transcriptional regulator [Consotaella salsifontis]|uniref:DNA-binding transcriptional regulator, MarR family n=1 Tax=Consotaella salsifontis TaxID=1365950 RepID=A0A1T4NKL8_9HYPH|nr:MarR family winged helix-turn-helix transcriptional regulator [Consotaella salsifontis]SJZ79841.1 DNA-binding transcriptional regulator, MarR family [Consotaella salsifontis]
MSNTVELLGRAIKELQTRHHRALDSRLTMIGSSLAQWDALRAIAHCPGASSHALARYTFQTDQSFGALVARLVDKGLVSRSAGRGRALAYSLTESGEAMFEHGRSIVEDVLTQSFAPLGEDERKHLAHLLDRLLETSD